MGDCFTVVVKRNPYGFQGMGEMKNYLTLPLGMWTIVDVIIFLFEFSTIVTILYLSFCSLDLWQKRKK